MMGHLNHCLARGGGNLNTDFPKIQMPGGCPGVDVEASIWLVHSLKRNFTGFLSAYFGQLFPSLIHHNKVPAFFNLVEVTLNGLCPIFHRTVFLSSENLPVFVCNSQKQSLYLDSGLIMWADHVRWSHHSLTSIVRLQYTLITHSSRPIKMWVLRCSLYNNKYHVCTVCMYVCNYVCM